jgi:hypothetical protein
MVNRILLSFLLAVMFVRSTAAVNLESFNLKGWQIPAYANDDTKEFSHCSAYSLYKSGIYLMFSLNRERQWYLGLFDPKWQLTPGKQYSFDVELDGSHGINWEGHAISKDSIRIPLYNTAELFPKFSNSKLLTIHGASATLRFFLDDSKKALEAMVLCTQRHLGSGTVVSNPFEKETLAPTVELATERLYAEAAVTATNLIASSGTTSYRLVPVDKVRTDFKGEHAVWFIDGTAGSLRILPQADSIENTASALMAIASNQCKGKFATGKSSNGNGGLKIEVVCEEQKEKISTYDYVLIARPAGGVYLFSIFDLDDKATSGVKASKLSEFVLSAYGNSSQPR